MPKETNPYPRIKLKGIVTYCHRDMAQWRLGRALKPEEVLHHKNGDKEDYHPDNLMVFSSHSAHMLFEHYLERQAAGIIHLYTIEDILKVRGEYFIDLGL